MTVEIIFIVPYQPYMSTGLFIYSMGVLAYQRLNYDISKKVTFGGKKYIL